MKTAFRVLLALSIVILTYLCYMSIITPIKFDEQRANREKVVIERLINIRKAQIEFRNKYGRYTGSFDTLVSFINTEKLPFVLKEGTISDYELEKGLTEKEALKIIKKGNQKEIIERGLGAINPNTNELVILFKRDTSYALVKDTLFGKNFAADSIAFVPFSEGKKFELGAGNIISASGFPIPVFECKTTYGTYLWDMNRQSVVNIIEAQTKIDKYPGLQVGSLTETNNNAGNWE